jgi:prephenate dehydrogenase
MKTPLPQHLRTAPDSLAGKTIGVVGLGQIGGSIVKCLNRHRPQIKVLGTDIDHSIAGSARRYCEWCTSVEEIVVRSDVLILAVHVPHILKLFPQVAVHARQRPRRPRLLVTDTGTVKDPVVRQARRYHGLFDFIGMHPLAGTQHPGWDGSNVRLFNGRTIVFCPDRPASRAPRIRELIRLLGATPLRMPSAEHDRYIGLTIGLPHLLAYSAQSLSRDLQVPAAVSGRSWESLTRVAASDPAMVAGFLSTNAKAVASASRQLSRRLDRLVAALIDPKGKRLESLLRRWRRDAAE